MSRAAPVIAGLLCCTLPAFGQGGGAVLYENGSPDMGSSYAGAGARANDAATAFQNPAGMARLEKSQIIIGTFAAIRELRLDLNASSSTTVPPGGDKGGGHQDALSPGLGSFAVLKLTDDLALGFTLNALAASGVDYSPDWEGRTFVTENQMVIANIEPALGYRVFDWLSVGAGLHLVFGRLDQQLKANDQPNSPDIEIDDADDWAVAGTVGILLEASDRTRIGVTYRSEVNLELTGDLDNPTPLTPEFDTELDLPQGVNISLYQQLTRRFALLADVGWSDWSTFDRQPTSISGGPLNAGIDRDWKDTWRVGIGAECRASDAWLFRTGFSYDTSPIDDDKRLPDVPAGDQFRFSLGGEHDFGEGKVVAFSYTLLYQPMDIDRVPISPNGAVVLDGEYDRSFVHFFGLSLSITFGGPRFTPRDEEASDAEG